MFSVTQQLVAPTIAQWGTDEQKATLRTRDAAHRPHRVPAVLRDRGRFRPRRRAHEGRRSATARGSLDGHKVWTSGARVADLGIAVCRTDPAAAKHAGLTVFLVPMDAPGVEVRPIRQMTGGSSFNEVYLDGVRAGRRPPARPGRRGLEGRPDGARRRAPRLGQPRPRQRRSRRRARPAPRTAARSSSATPSPTSSPAATSSGSPACGSPRPSSPARHPGPRRRSASCSPPTPWRVRPRSSACCSARELTVDSGAWGTWAWTEHVLGAPGYRIAGGTDEIQHNILAERVLGLPREPRA